MSQESLIQSFNTDLFLRFNKKAKFKIQEGYAGSIFVNGHSLETDVADSSLYQSLYTRDSSVATVSLGGGETASLVDIRLEPSNESIVTYIDENDINSYNTVENNVETQSPHNQVSILYDSQDAIFYIKGKTNCDTLLSLNISPNTDTSVFSTGFRRLETGRIIKLKTDQDNSVLVTLIKAENIIFSGLKYIGGKITVAINNSDYEGLAGNVSEVIVNPREIDGDFESGFDERTIKISTVDAPTALHTFNVNITSDGNHDELKKNTTRTAIIQPDGIQEYNFETIYIGELYSTELYVSSLENIYDGETNYTLISSPLHSVQSKVVEIDSSSWVYGITTDSSLDTSGFIHVHIDSSSDFWFKYATCEPNEEDLPDTYEDYLFEAGWNYEQALRRPERLVGNQASFALLRANPKLTGNIKIVVDSDQNLFLDTFKVSNTLSNSAFRKISIDKNEYYGRTLMKKFRNVSSEEIFKVEDYCYDVFSYSTNLDDQYYDLYNYGVRTNSDKIYSENFSFLAPLKVKKIIPDFFIIFRVEPNENGKYYNDENEYSSAEHIKYFLEHGEIIKTYDMREGSSLGDFIRNFYEKSKEYSGDCYVTYDYNRNNAFNGISIDRGVVIQAQESNALTREVLSQASLNDWLTLGFERNRIVSKDIINLEFMFNDLEREMFSLNTYFGLYIRLNGEDENFSCIGINNDFPVFDYDVTGKTFDASSEENKSLIYGMMTPDGFERLRYNIQSRDAKDLMSKYMKKPYENIIHTKIVDIDDEIFKDYSYASIKFEDVLDPGEHFRIIDVNENSKEIYEVVISNIDNPYFDISEIHNETHNGFNIHTISIYKIGYRSEHQGDKQETLRTQLELIAAAFNSFDTDKIECMTNGTNSVSILYKRKFTLPENLLNLEDCEDFVIIEKVTSTPGINNEQKIKQSEYTETYSKLFGFDDLHKIYTNPTSSTLNDILYPFGFEFSGTRVCYASFFTPLMKEDAGENFSTYLIEDDITKDISSARTVLFKTKEKNAEIESKYKIYNGFDVLKLSPDGAIEIKTAFTIPGFGHTDSYLVKFYEDLPDINGGYLNFFNGYPINAGLCSIFTIKDPYTDILDVDNKLNDEVISNDGGEYNNVDVYGTRCYPGSEIVSEDDITDYFDKYKVFRNKSNDITDGKLFKEMRDNKKNRSDISLLFNYCCKFKSLGTDKSGNQIKIMFDISNSYRNAVDFSDNGDQFIGFVTIDNKKINSDEIIYPKYINNNLVYKDHVEYKDYVLYGEGSISDLLYFNGSTNNKFSIAYRYGNDSIEFISSSLKIRVRSNNLNIIDIAKYNNYSAILICCAGNNSSHDFPIDLIIDEIKEEIAIIYYIGLSSKETKIGQRSLGEFKNLPHCSKLTENEFNGGLFLLPKDNLSKKSLNEINGSSSEQRFIFLNGSRKKNGFTEDKLKWGTSKYKQSEYNDTLLENFIITINSDSEKSPMLFSDGSALLPVQASIEKYMYSDSPSDLFAKTEADVDVITAKELKEIFEKNHCGIFIKSHAGTKNLSKVENIIEFNIFDTETGTREDKRYKPLLGANRTFEKVVYSSSAEVAFKDMFVFNYTENELSTIFEKNLDGCNIRLTDVSVVEQLFMKKYKYDNSGTGGADSSENAYSTGIVEHKKLNPLMNCFNEDVSIFKIVSDSSIISQTSLQTGYEKNTFLGSRGLCLKTKDGDTLVDEITITEWTDSITKPRKNITLNITSSIVNYISKTPGFKSIWRKLELYNIADESKYIENTIMKFIVVDEMSKFELYRKKTAEKFKFNTRPEKNLNGFELVDNVENSLSFVNGNYLLRISNLKDNYEYAAKLIIKL